MDARKQRRKRLDAAVKNGGFDRHGPCVICGVDFMECPHSYGEVENLIDAYRQAALLKRYI